MRDPTCGPRVLGFLVTQPNVLNMTGFRDKSNTSRGGIQAKNIRSYAAYLEEKVYVYRELKVDFTTANVSRADRPSRAGASSPASPRSKAITSLRNLSLKDDLFNYIQVCMRQMGALLGCKVLFSICIFNGILFYEIGFATWLYTREEWIDKNNDLIDA